MVYLKAKISELGTKSMIKKSRYLYRGISDCKSRTNVVKDEKDDMVPDCHGIC